MALHVSQFARLPHGIKAATFIVCLLIILCILFSSHSPPGTSLVWVTLVVTLLLDLSAAAILVFELEEVVFPLARKVTYAMTESMGALLLCILYFISIWMCYNASKWTPKSNWTIAALLCFANTILFAFDFFQYFRQWLNETREAANSLNIGTPVMYGISIN